ncbi:MAG: AbrB/MazE/SpoVT family DNA-binding domain-containing protein [SAR202 cluster bacterium]|nr:AbrB/MazE/SpoVT family DNA-binding domain-containing protein [SAR202 cluster bacterium]
MKTPTKEILASVSKRGQVTIPAEVRRLIGVKTKGKVSFKIKGDQVIITKPAFTLEEVYGSVQFPKGPIDFKELTRDAWAEKLVRDFKKFQKK